MKNNIERFIRDNREAFDSQEPSPQLWDRIEKEMGWSASKGSPIRKLRWTRLVAAASLVLIAGSAILYFVMRPTVKPIATVKEQTDKARPADGEIAAIDPGYARQVAYFTTMIDQKATELKAIEKDNPALYRMFTKDIGLLDSTYALLKKQLPVNPNKEELLQAMIQNLQIQIDLLNQQLSVIQKIKQAKNNPDEKINTNI